MLSLQAQTDKEKMHIPTCRCSQTAFPLTVLLSVSPVWKPAEDKGKTGIANNNSAGGCVCVCQLWVSTVHSVAFSWAFFHCPLFVIAC